MLALSSKFIGERSMMKSKALILIALIVLISSTFTMVVNATTPNEGSLSSGYAVTSNWHGTDVPFGAQVIVTAMTTNSRVDEVRFIWKNPTDKVDLDVTVNVFTNGTTFDGKLVYYAISTFNPKVAGDWGVQVKFYDELHFCHFEYDIRLATRATSFNNVIPEAPVLGTAGISLAMVLGLAIKARRKPVN
jgi:hypothetical protein